MERTIFALGFFDGVHLGHQALLAATVKLAAKAGAIPGAVTFSAHPDGLVLGAAPGLLNTGEDRDQLLRGYGIQRVLELPFDKEVMNTRWESFLTQLVEKGGVGFVCGDDFRFGAGGTGTAEKLAEFCQKQGLPYAIVPQQEIDGVRVSSTHIRCLLEKGEMEQVNRFLGHPHVLSGEVVKGRGLGHTIGIPTANVLIPEGLAVPKLGVYAGKVLVDGNAYLAVTNIGSRPTVGGHQVRMESWLLDFDGDLYGKTITLALLNFLRPERKFDSLEELKAQVLQDAQQVREMKN
jgi:riboflavin kinase/FMN adenylyltransferase